MRFRRGLYLLGIFIVVLIFVSVFAQRLEKRLQGKLVTDRYWQIEGTTEECSVELIGRELPPQIPSDCPGPFALRYYVVIEDNDPDEFMADLWFKLEPGTKVLIEKDYLKLIQTVEVK